MTKIFSIKSVVVFVVEVVCHIPVQITPQMSMAGFQKLTFLRKTNRFV